MKIQHWVEMGKFLRNSSKLAPTKLSLLNSSPSHYKNYFITILTKLLDKYKKAYRKNSNFVGDFNMQPSYLTSKKN